LCSVCAPFIMNETLTCWKIAASFHNCVLR